MPDFTTSDGVRLHYTDDGEGPVMLFVSGWCMSGEWYCEQRDFFKKINRVIILDTRAQGKSEPVEFGHRLSRHAADINEFIEALGLDQIVFVAWSRGSGVLMSYLELFGTRRVDRIALIGYLPSLAARADWPWGFNVPPQEFIDSVVGDYPNVVSNMIVDMTHQVLPDDFVQARTEESLKTPPIAASRMLQDHMNIDWRDFVPKIDVPVLICAGAEDPQAPIGAANATAELLPDAQVLRFEKSGHCAFIEEPEDFNRGLAAFARR
ncbi:MAG: alpha/beta hydrolase [Hyphomicrobiaceae bacterium]|nr:alpha/beta hydrolase [Hyphomicrobiaceae bacterium]